MITRPTLPYDNDMQQLLSLLTQHLGLLNPDQLIWRRRSTMIWDAMATMRQS